MPVDRFSLHAERCAAARGIDAARDVGEQGTPVVSWLCGRSTASAGSHARHWSSHSPQHGRAFMQWSCAAAVRWAAVDGAMRDDSFHAS